MTNIINKLFHNSEFFFGQVDALCTALATLKPSLFKRLI